MNAQLHASRLAALRAMMQQHGIAACLVPSADPHLSEYLPEHWQARAWLTGFDGSAGTLVATADFAGVWTDSRYFEQAERQLAGSGIELVRQRIAHAPEHIGWLAERLGPGTVLAVAGDSLSVAGARALQRQLDASGATLRTDLDLPGLIWPERPVLPQRAVTAHPDAYAGTPRADKLARVRAAMREAGASHHLVSTLDDIAWLTNLRGSDVDYNPVFLAHLLLDTKRATLFAGAGRFDAALLAALAADGIAVRDYGDMAAALTALPATARLLIDPQRCVVALLDAVPAAVQRSEAANPSVHMKAVKSAHELGHIRDAMRQDGAALVTAMHAIERDLVAGVPVTELDVDRRLREARAAHPDFVGESFATIAGYMANGALPHYRATAENHASLALDGLLLIDSGGQYLGGTTDITRVWAFGQTSAEQRHDATRVLQGMIHLSRAHFPAGASGPQLDALARAPIWADNADYGHGTGHGVGYFLNVHEGPHGIRPPVPGGALVPLEPGMIVSIEPGLYKPGRHGIRHENLAVVRTAAETEFGSFFAFETLTLCPIDTRAIEAAQLEPSERAWLNTYHAQVEAALAPLLGATDRAWLHTRCTPV
ncbi:MAG TPA: aminopeptidase P family protein [Rhodanobacteraceae bacterium]|nr:aminopeptidase P family protein [Rhodanobacteraceae bacterium]